MVYHHITSWEVNAIKVETIYSTNWQESNYWQHKQTATNEIAQVTDSFIIQLQELFSALGKNVDVGTFSAEIQKSKYYAELLKEYIFEDVRVNEFPDKPSRKRCMFLLPQEVNLVEYGRSLNYPLTGKTLLEVEVLENSSVHHADLKLLDCNAISHAGKIEAAREYWSGHGAQRNDFTTEILFFGNFKVKRILQTNHK